MMVESKSQIERFCDAVELISEFGIEREVTFRRESRRELARVLYTHLTLSFMPRETGLAALKANPPRRPD